ncbi:MAG TPA: DUF4340 domain-containing protein [Candidatus Limnocylindria bacterium]|jgi:hypothetical protein|nr:DUF4340 domain-containing protein [Candidatus Limnocylindria bacterium]
MKSKQLLVLVVAAAVLGGGGLWVLNNREADFGRSTTDMGGKLLGTFDVNAVAGLRLTQGTNTLNVVKSGEGWIVKERGGYPANFGEIAELVRKLADLKVAQPLRVGASRLGMLELTKDTATTVELLGSDGKAIKTLLVGKKHSRGGAEDSSPFGGGPMPDGRYVMTGNDLASVAVVADPLSSANAKPEEWLAKDFIKVEQPVYVQVTAAEATNSFQLTRTNEFADWTLTDLKPGEEADKNKLSGFGSVLSGPGFNDVLVNPDLKALGLDHPTETVIRTATGFTYKVHVGNLSGEESYPMQVNVDASLATTRTPGKEEKPEEKAKLDKEFADKLAKQQEKLKAEQALSKWTFTVSKWTLDSLLKKRGDLLADKKTEGKPPGETPATVIDPSKFGLPGAN